MKHAGPATLLQLRELLAGLRAIGGLREPKCGTFYRGSSAFLHFHEDSTGLFADVKIDGRAFTRFTVSSPADQRKLLELVSACIKKTEAHGRPGSRQ